MSKSSSLAQDDEDVASAHVNGNSRKQEIPHLPTPVSWKKSFFGIGPEDPQNALPRSRLIYPLSTFGLVWLVITAVFLIYTGIVTAPLVAFYWLDPQCSVVPTLFLDTVIDIFFLVDILVNFKTGIFEAGEYIDDPAVVTKAYLKGSFTFDCFTSFPVSFFEQAAKAVCDSGNDPADTGALRVVRALKPLRFIKIIRIMKVGKAGPLIAHLMDYWNISPKQGKTWRLMVVLVMSIHMVACAWWLWKVMGMKLDEVNDFLDAQSWGQHERSDLMTDEGKIEAYIIAVYVTTMTLTTVGYGDISADNTSERVGYIVLFIAGAFIWGELMAGLGEIHQALS